MALIAMNILNVEHNVEQCAICKLPLTDGVCYTLPECHHTFHTACVVAWFRAGDCRCPICRHTGINSLSEEGNAFITRGFVKKNPRFKEIAAYAKKHPDKCPKYVLNLLIKRLSEEVTQQKKEYRTFLKDLKESSVNYNEAHRTKKKLRDSKWEKERKIYLCQRELLQIPIVPLIIPSGVFMD